MKCGRYLCFLFLFVLFTFILPLKTNAESGNMWALYIDPPDNMLYYGITSSGYVNRPVSYYNYDTINGQRQIYYTTNTVSNDSNGFIFANYAGTLKAHYLYSFQYYMCGTNDKRPNKMSASAGSSIDNLYNSSQIEYSSASYSTLNLVPDDYLGLGFDPDPAHHFTWCTANVGLVSTSADSYYLGIKFRNDNGNTTRGYYAIIGYKLNELGLYSGTLSSAIDNAISDADLATSSSITQVNNSIHNMEQNISNSISSASNQAHTDSQNTQDAINSTNDDVGDEDVDGYGDFFDDFEDPMPSSVTDVVTAPLDFIGAISDSCQPVNLSLFNSSVTLPCGDDIFWNRSDVSTFRTIWNLLIGGVAIYGLLFEVFKIYEKLLDPLADVKISPFKFGGK